MPTIKPGKWVSPDKYSCKGYTRDRAPRSCYSSESFSLPNYPKSHVTSGRRKRTDDYLTCNDSTSEESSEKSALAKTGSALAETQVVVYRKSCFDRNGQTVGYLICIGTILAGLGLGAYFGIQVAVGQTSSSIPNGVGQTSGSISNGEESGDIDSQFIPTISPKKSSATQPIVVAQAPVSAVTEKITPAPKSCVEYNTTDGVSKSTFLGNAEKTKYAKAVCACRFDSDENKNEKEENAENTLNKIENYLKGFDDHKLKSAGDSHLEFGDCKKEEEEKCDFNTIKWTKSGNCWTKKDDGTMISHSDDEDCVKFSFKKPIDSMIKEEDSKCISKNEEDTKHKYPLRLSPCLDARFRKHSAHCGKNSGKGREEGGTHFYFSNWDHSKCLGTDVKNNKHILKLIDCSKITLNDLWISDNEGTYRNLFFKSTALGSVEHTMKLNFDTKTSYLTRHKAENECRMYDPIENIIKKGFQSCETATIWNDFK